MTKPSRESEYVPSETRPEKMGPLELDHPLIGDLCPACNVPFKEGELVTLVVLGPGDDPEERKKAREGEPYHAVALPLHWACATGEE